MEYQTTLPAFWEICMQVKKQQLEPDMEQWIGSKLGKEYIKAVYCHLACLTYMQSTSCEMPGWMKHKMESRLLGERSKIKWKLLSHVRLCVTPEIAAHQVPLYPGFSRQERWSGLPFPSPMHESEKWKWSHLINKDFFKRREKFGVWNFNFMMVTFPG